MLRAATLRRVARTAAIGAGGAAVAGGTGVAVYTFSEQGLGLKREFQFWGLTSHIIFDYWWNVAQTSPYTKYRKLMSSKDEDTEEARKQWRKEKLQELHQRNAPEIFNVMLELGGLYIKLGQVLSVTALPIPEEYREYFRTLQSNVPGHEEFETVIKPTVEKELGKPLEEIFESFDEIPCGAASIGQAHKAKLRETGQEVIVKVQYPDAKWQVPADIECVGDFMKLCVWFDVIDEEASNLSFNEFSRQFLAELDYQRESENLQQVYESSLDPAAPYIHRRVVLPKVFHDLSTKQLITMTYLPGPKFQDEAEEQLKMLGFNNKKGIRSIVQEAAKDITEEPKENMVEMSLDQAESSSSSRSWKLSLSKIIGNWIGVDSIFSLVRLTRKIMLWSTAAAVSGIRVGSSLSLVPEEWQEWAETRRNAALLAQRLDWTQDAVHALLDVHGYQILNQGLFNADPHPGNILVVQDENSKFVEPKIGLIDYGQCKRLTPEERVRVAKLILSVAEDESDEIVASHFRSMGIQTKNDSTRFLATFARLMFGSFKPEHLDHSFHKELHREDKVLYFPNELSMVYRTSLLLRGLAVSLQYNVSIGEQWRHHAKTAIEEYETR